MISEVRYNNRNICIPAYNRIISRQVVPKGTLVTQFIADGKNMNRATRIGICNNIEHILPSTRSGTAIQFHDRTLTLYRLILSRVFSIELFHRRAQYAFLADDI